MVPSNVHRFATIRTFVLVELFILGLVASTAAPAPAQATFEKAIATPQSSYAQDVQQTSDGGYVVGANYCSGSCYFALISKLDSSRNLQWQKQYQLPGFQTQLNASRQTSDGGYVWAGYLPYFNGCPGCAFVAKLDSNGDIQWQNSYRGLDVAQANDIHQTTDGGFVIGGYTAPSQFGTQQAWMAKLDSSGSVQWQKSLSDSNSACYGAYGSSVQQTTGGGYVLVGYTSVYPSKVLVVKFDSNGNVSWQTQYSSPGGSSAGCSIQQTSDGGYIVGGYNYVSTQSALALKLDSGGKVQWAKTYGETGATTSQFNSVRHAASEESGASGSARHRRRPTKRTAHAGREQKPPEGNRNSKQERLHAPLEFTATIVDGPPDARSPLLWEPGLILLPENCAKNHPCRHGRLLRFGRAAR